jgi:hypothetical protein
VYLCTYPRASKLALSPTPNTQECFRLHPLFWRIIPDDMSIPLRRFWSYRGGAMQTFTLTRTSPFGDSPKFAPECGWWHHGSGRKIDPPPEKRVRKE